MNFHAYFGRPERPVETCVVGSGGFGQSFLAQGLRVPAMRARIAVDIDTETAAGALRAAGVDPRCIRACASAGEAQQAWRNGHFIAAGDVEIVLDLPFDVLIEATGRPEPGARHALLAIGAGKHVALVSKEVDSVIGPGLAHRAAQAGLVVTPVDGDQPSLLIGLATWAEVLGFDIVAAGKSSEYDFVFDPMSERVTSSAHAAHVPGFGRHWAMGERSVAELVEQRAQALAAFPQRAVPDLCELAVVANATGLLPDRPDLHAPVARPIEVPTIFSTEGGLLSGTRRLDVFHCLRLPDETSFAGGVFVVVRCEDRSSWDMLAEKGHVVSRDRGTAMVYLPRHLLGLEAATSVLDAAIHGRSGYGLDHRPRVDIAAMATEDLPAGRLLAMGGHHHTIDGVTAEFRPGAALAPDTPAPFYLAADRKLVRPVAKGEPIRIADIEIDEGSDLFAARRAQDAAFFD